MNEIAKIKKSEFFNEITEEDVKDILSHIKYSIVNYEEGRVLFTEGEECKSIGLILEGCIQLGRIYQNGKELVLKKLCEGDVFGEALIFSNSGVYPATIIAKSNCKIAYINKIDIIKLCSINEKILENFVTLLSDKVIMLNNKVKNISFKSVKHKVVNYLLEKSVEGKTDKVILKESKEDIATYIGVPRPSFSRELIKLRDEGIIYFDRHYVSILDIEALEEKLFD